MQTAASHNHFFFWPPAAILNPPSRGPAPRGPPHRCLGSERKSSSDWKFQTVWPLLPVIFLGVCCPQETRNSSRLHCFPVLFFFPEYDLIKCQPQEDRNKSGSSYLCDLIVPQIKHRYGWKQKQTQQLLTNYVYTVHCKTLYTPL